MGSADAHFRPTVWAPRLRRCPVDGQEMPDNRAHAGASTAYAHGVLHLGFWSKVPGSHGSWVTMKTDGEGREVTHSRKFLRIPEPLPLRKNPLVAP